jgi:hypothetical protein
MYTDEERKQKAKEARKRYCQKNKEKQMERVREWQKNNPEKVKKAQNRFRMPEKGEETTARGIFLTIRSGLSSPRSAV